MADLNTILGTRIDKKINNLDLSEYGKECKCLILAWGTDRVDVELPDGRIGTIYDFDDNLEIKENSSVRCIFTSIEKVDEPTLVLIPDTEEELEEQIGTIYQIDDNGVWLIFSRDRKISIVPFSNILTKEDLCSIENIVGIKCLISHVTLKRVYVHKVVKIIKNE